MQSHLARPIALAFVLWLVAWVPTGSARADGPNLVPNPSFETFTTCPNSLDQITFAPPWNSPTAHVAEYLNACASGGFNDVPNNLYGSQAAHTGVAYSAIEVYWHPPPGHSGVNAREYLQAPLIAPLQSGHEYRVSFWVSLTDSQSAWAIEEISAHLSVGAVGPLPGSGVLNLVPQVTNTSGPLASTTAWMLVTGTFFASGGEDHVIIGNFLPDLATTAIPAGGHSAIVNYYVDDITVCATGVVNLCPGNDACVGVVESETCGTHVNDGCNLNPPAVAAISCGDTVCGTFFWNGTTRDTDFFQFTLSCPATVTWEVWADAPVVAYLIEASNCPSPVFHAIGTGTCPTLATAALAAGTYWAFVAPDFLGAPFACGAPGKLNEYRATLSCVALPCACGDPVAGPCTVPHATPFCSDFFCCHEVCYGFHNPPDPYCCTVSWDAACVARAMSEPACGAAACPGGTPPNVFTCDAGCDDGFAAAGFEPATSPCPFASTCVDFDDVATDSCFAHTFEGCWPSCQSPCATGQCGTIVAAFLELTLQVGPAGQTPDPIDSLSLLDGCNDVAGWTLPMLQAAGALHPNGTLVLDLGNLPPHAGQPTSVLDTLCDGEFGIVLGDDVSVDHARLTVLHCPCAAPATIGVSVEAPDNFTGPTPTTPDGDLLTALVACGAPILAYDDPQPLGCFGDTLWFPDGCVAGATLSIGIRPTTHPPQVEHELSLEVVDACDETFAWSVPLIQLQSAGLVSPPFAFGVTSVVTLDLASLPPDANGTRSVLGHLLDGALDVSVATLMGVDFVELTVEHCTCIDSVPGDIDGDGLVNGTDLAYVLSAWGMLGRGTDLNGDGTTNGADLAIVLSGWTG